MSDDRQHRIRQRAHAIWERQGHQHGADRDHWHQATQEIDAEDAAAAKKPVRAPKPKATTTNAVASVAAEAAAGKKPAAKRKAL